MYQGWGDTSGYATHTKSHPAQNTFFITLSAILPSETQPESEREQKRERGQRETAGILSRIAGKAEGREALLSMENMEENINPKISCWEESHETVS